MKKVIMFLVIALMSVTLSATLFKNTSFAEEKIIVAAAEDKIVIAVDAANPPFMYGDADVAKGVYPGLLQKIFEKMGKTVEVKGYPWKRALVMGEKGTAAVGGIYKNEARLKIFDYSDPIFDEKLNLYVRKGEIFVFKNISDLSNNNIGVIRGWSYGDDFDKGIKDQIFKVEENVSDELNFKKLIAKRLSCVIAIEQSADMAIAKLGYQEKAQSLAESFAVNPTYLVFAKSQNKQALLEQFNNTLKTMKADGSYEALIKELFQQEAPK
ncbi:MAG: transporter substrate-binding domain-containing protein [Desulfamplus sp.]|nr:transporter substrate-binding domain-containing protein [Desulfamplus sp.]